MGTRADFYVGAGPAAEWIGSIAYDGHPSWQGKPAAWMRFRSERGFRRYVNTVLAKRDDFTCPADGWPWPWQDSKLTDYAYGFVKGRVRVLIADNQGWKAKKGLVVEFPDMTKLQRVTFGPRSGILLVRI